MALLKCPPRLLPIQQATRCLQPGEHTRPPDLGQHPLTSAALCPVGLHAALRRRLNTPGSQARRASRTRLAVWTATPVVYALLDVALALSAVCVSWQRVARDISAAQSLTAHAATPQPAEMVEVAPPPEPEPGKV